MKSKPNERSTQKVEENSETFSIISQRAGISQCEWIPFHINNVKYNKLYLDDD